MKLKKPMVFKTTYDTYTATDFKEEGGSGRIYRAEDGSNSTCAIKLLDPGKVTKEKKKRFKNELQFCLKNEHKNIVTIIDHGIFEDSPFYVMPFYEGSLRQLLSAGIISSKVLPYFAQILDGVEAAHLQNVVHRDLKPENVLYDSTNDRLLIADFGIARFEEEDLFTAVETKDTTRLANFQYAAPEQRGRGTNVDNRADIYALGLLLNEMFTNEVPYGTGYKAIENVSPAYKYLDSLVSEMLRQTPDERPSTIEAIKAELIGRKIEFIEKQRISELKQKVVSESDLDDPLILDPPRLVRHDYDNGTLLLFLNQPVNPRWITALRMSIRSFMIGREPERFIISGDTVRVGAEDAKEAQLSIDIFKNWLPGANRMYEKIIRAEIKETAERERKRIQNEIEEREQRHRILKNVKI
jgi:serine/threonine protein kinase